MYVNIYVDSRVFYLLIDTRLNFTFFIIIILFLLLSNVTKKKQMYHSMHQTVNKV